MAFLFVARRGVALWCVGNNGVHLCTCQVFGDRLSTIGARLRDEREHLGLSQAAFAEVGGVQKRAQINYEKDERHPDAGYLAAIAAAGVDVLYVLTGQRSQSVTGQSNPATSQHLLADPVAPPLTDQAATAGQVPAMPKLSRREQALLANYRGSDEEGRRAMEATASALAHRDSAKPQRNGGE